MKAIYLDCFSGISGNMFLGALLQAGFSFDVLQQELAKLNLGKYELIYKPVTKCGIRADYFDVKLLEHSLHERHLNEIKNIITDSTLKDTIKAKANSVFRELARAESEVHGISMEEVHFHEVGAVDTIIDIVGVLLALDYLHIEKIFFGNVKTGYGFVECAHGTLPVPAPATASLLKGIPCEVGKVEGELLTPTGAVLLKCLGEYCEQPFAADKIAYGAGSKDLSIPNVVRLYMGEYDSLESDTVIETSCNLDDETGEIIAYTANLLLAEGALDVWTEPVFMKKGRVGTKLSFLATSAAHRRLCEIVLKETSALGLRFAKKERYVLQRKIVEKDTPFGKIKVKIAIFPDGKEKLAPEYEDCAKIAREKGIALKEIYDYFQRIC